MRDQILMFSQVLATDAVGKRIMDRGTPSGTSGETARVDHGELTRPLMRAKSGGGPPTMLAGPDESRCHRHPFCAAEPIDNVRSLPGRALTAGSGPADAAPPHRRVSVAPLFLPTPSCGRPIPGQILGDSPFGPFVQFSDPPPKDPR